MGGLYREKGFNDFLAPLFGFLKGSVGRPWDQVHSEIAAQLSGRSTMQRHVLGHVSDFVCVHARWVEGVLYLARGGRKPERADLQRWPPLYVCPRTGLLRRTPRKRRRGEDPNFRKLSDTTYWMRCRGGWFEVRLAARPKWSALFLLDPVAWNEQVEAAPFDALAHAQLGTARERGFYARNPCPWSGGFYAVSVRQLSKKEIRSSSSAH